MASEVGAFSSAARLALSSSSRARTSSRTSSGPAVAVGLPLAAPGVFVDLVVEDELAGGRDVGPAVGVEDGAVHGGVEVAQLLGGGAGFASVVEAVVGFGHALVVLDH